MRKSWKSLSIPPPALVRSLAAACLLAASIGPAFAQATDPPGRERQPRGGEPRTEQRTEPRAAPRKEDKGAPRRDTPAKPVDPKAPDAADTAERRPAPAPKAPQTAAEKSKLLADLYAQLATAEDEQTATRLAGAIERLWTFSGSDTTSLLIERAGAALKQKRADLARKLLDHAVSLSPDYTEAFTQRAYYHYSENNLDAAVGDLRRVLALDPNHFKALEGLVQIWRDTGNKKGALGVLKQLIDVHPFASGAKAAFEELQREVEGQGI